MDDAEKDDWTQVQDAEQAPDYEVETFRGDLGSALGSPVAIGQTSGLSNHFNPTCVSNSSAQDASYTWTAPSSGTFVFNTSGSGFDTILEIRRYNDNVSLGCNDDASGTLQSSVSVSLSAGQSVLVVIDGYSSATGPYQLNINGSGGSIPSSGLHLWLRSDRGVTASGGGFPGGSIRAEIADMRV